MNSHRRMARFIVLLGTMIVVVCLFPAGNTMAGAGPQTREQLLQTCAGGVSALSENACRQVIEQSAQGGEAWLGDLASETLLTRLAAAAEKVREYSAAIYLWRLATQRYTEKALYHYRLGRVLVDELGAYEEAYGPLLTTVSIQPDFTDALLSLGFVQRRMNRPVEAVASYEAALRVVPTSTEALTGLAMALEDVRKYKEALDVLDRIDRAGPFGGDTRLEPLLRANALFWLGRAREAQAVLRAASEQSTVPIRERMLCGSATVSKLIGDDVESERACKAIEPPSPCACILWERRPGADLPVFTDAEADVAAAALGGLFGRAGGPTGTLVVAEVAGLGLTSAAASAYRTISTRLQESAKSYEPAVQSALDALLFQKRQAKRVQFPPAATSVRIIRRGEMRSMFYGDGPSFVDKFDKPNGLIMLSVPAYNGDGTAAAIFVQRIERIDDRPGTVVLLQRRGATWHIVAVLNTINETPVTR